MLLTSWVRSFRQSLKKFRPSGRRNRSAAPKRALHAAPAFRGHHTEKLEERTLLTSLVFDSTNVNPATGIQVTNLTLDPDNDGVSNFDRVVIDTVSFSGDGGRGVDINVSDLTGLDSIVIESLDITGTGGTGVDITLDNVTLVDGVVVESSSITSTSGGGIDFALTDVVLGTLTVFDTMVSSGPGVGVTIDVLSQSRNSVINGLDFNRNVVDGLSINSDGTTGTISAATNDTQIQIRAIDHGLQTGSTVTIQGVTGNIAANTTDTIFIDPGDPEAIRDNFFVLPNTDGSVGLLPSGELNGVYSGGGTWTVPTTLANVSITDNTITDTTLAGEEGILVSLRNTDTPNFSISENNEIKGIQVDLDNAPISGLSIRNNALIDSTAIDGIGFTALNSDISGVRLEGNTVQGDGLNGGNAISFTLTDSNFDGFVLDNTIIDPLAHGLVVTPSASTSFLAENGGPLSVQFTGDGISNNRFVNTPGNNNAGAALSFDLAANTAMVANITDNSVTGFQQGGLDFQSDNTIDQFDLTITDNRFNNIAGPGVAVVLLDGSTGVLDISRNAVTNTSAIPGGEPGHGIVLRLIGDDLNAEAANILRRSTIADNRIGTGGSGRVGVSMTAASASLIVDDISGFTTSLTDEISDTATTLTVENVSRLPTTPGFDIRIGSEELRVTAISGDTLTVTRGVNSTTATVHDENDVVTPLDFGIIVDGERMTVTNVTNNTLTLAPRTNEDTDGDGFSGSVTDKTNLQDANGDGVFNRPVAHAVGAPIVTTHGGVIGGGIVIDLQEESEVQDLLIDGNFIANAVDDGIKFERDDNARLTIVDPRIGQRRALTISNNAIMAAGSETRDQVTATSGLVTWGAGIDIIARNSAIDTLDFEIRGNTIAGNIGAPTLDPEGEIVGNLNSRTRGISLRSEADANILADITGNLIQFNSGEGIEASARAGNNDERDVGGTWIGNTITHNGATGIRLQGSLGVSPVQPIFIGLEGTDPDSGLSRGNVISNNGDSGIIINDANNGFIAIVNNTIELNGRNGAVGPNVPGATILPNGSGSVINGTGIDLRVSLNSAIKGNRLIDNAGIGIDINNSTGISASIRENLITGSGNDGIEFQSNTQATLLGNAIDSNVGRGVEIINSGNSNIKIGDGTEEGRNLIVGNRQEGVYVVNTPDGGQDQNSRAGVLSRNGSLNSSPNLIFQLDTNSIEDNGRDSTNAATGVVLRVGSSNAGSPGQQVDPYSITPGTAESVGDQSAVGTNGRVNARVVNNTFQGNFNTDFEVRSFTATVDPPTTQDCWGLLAPCVGSIGVAYRVLPSYRRDPLARLNLVFSENTGNSLGSLGGGGGGYNNSEPIFKSRLGTNPPPQGGPGGPFTPASAATRSRSIQNVASRTGLRPFSFPNAAPTLTNTVVSATSGEGTDPVIITSTTSIFGQGGSAQNLGPLTIVDPGGQFTAAPAVNIFGGGGTGAMASAALQVESYQINQQGTGFVLNAAPPTVFVTPDALDMGVPGTLPGGATATAILTDSVTGFNITNPGGGYNTPPSVTITDGGGAQVAFADVSMQVAGVIVPAGGVGAGFTVGTPVTFSLPSGPGPQVRATGIISTVGAGGVITGVAVTNPGSGYSNAPTASVGGFAFQTFTSLNSLIVTDGGVGIVNQPTVTFFGGTPAAGQALTVPAAEAAFGIEALNVVGQGQGFTLPPDITFNQAGGRTGRNFDITTFFELNIVQVTNPGSGYSTSPTVTLLPNGDGTAQVIVADSDRSHGLQAGLDVEITGVQTNDPNGIHSANGVFTVSIPIDPVTGFPDTTRFSLDGTNGTNSPDHIAFSGSWTNNNSQPLVNIGANNPNNLSFLYDGLGPSTFRIAQGFDSVGAGQEFNSGSQFTFPTWTAWVPLVDIANPNSVFTNSFVDPSVSTFPVAEFVPVTPDPRRVDAGVVTVNFTEPVTGVDIHDFRLTRDGLPVDITTIPVIQLSPEQYTLDLSSVTDVDGDYELIVDNANPTAVITPVSPDPRMSDAGIVTVTFSEDVTGVDIYDFALSLNLNDGAGFLPVDLSETGFHRDVQQISLSEYQIDLSNATDTVGQYRLDLVSAFTNAQITGATADGINDVNVLAINHGLATGMAVSISGIGGLVADGTYRITAVDADNFTLNNTAAISTPGADNFGLYSFTPNIIDGIGLPLNVSVSDTWTRANDRPNGMIVDVSPDPRDRGVDTGFGGPGTGDGVRIIFTEPIRETSFTINDLSLTRDIGLNPFPVDLTGANVIADPRFRSVVTLAGTPITMSTQFLVTGLQTKTSDVGRYRLTLAAGSVTDLSNTTLEFADFDEWDVILDGPSPLALDVFEPGSPANVDALLDTYNTSIRSLLLTFDEPVTGTLSAEDFVIVRTNLDGSVEQLDASGVMVEDLTGIGTTFRLSNLISVTEDSGTPIDGQYSFTLSHINDANTGNQIFNAAGDPLAVSATAEWITDTLRPTANLFNTVTTDGVDDFNPTPRIDNDAGFITLEFTERVTGIDRFAPSNDFTLELDREDGMGFVDITSELLANSVQLIPIDPTFRDGTPAAPLDTTQNDPVLGLVPAEVFATRYSLDLSNVATGLGNDGNYRLTLNGSIVDVTGNEFTAPDPITSDRFVPPPVVLEWTRVPLPVGLPSTIFDAAFAGNPLLLEARENFVVDMTIPEVVVGSVNVAPDPRNAAVGIVTINFTEDVTGVDVNDFALTRDGGNVDLSALSVVQVTPSSYTLDLNLVTGADGLYRFFIDGNNSLIEDGAGNAIDPVLAELDSWTTDIDAPGATFDAITSPRTDVPDTVRITFDEVVEVADIQITDFVLTRDAGAGVETVDLQTLGATVTAQDEAGGLATIFDIDLSAVADTEATYQLTLDAALSEISDDADNVIAITASVGFAVDQTSPSADIIDIAPDPRTSSVGLVNIIFSDSVTGVAEGVLGFDATTDLSLTRDINDGSGPQPVNISGLTLTQQTPSRYTIDLTTVTATNGLYELTVLTAGVTDLAGNPLTAPAVDAWQNGDDTTPPAVNLLNVAPDPGNQLTTNAGIVTVGFTEDVSGVDIDDFRLFRDSNSVDLTGITVSPVPGTAAQYTIDLTSVTELSGSYELQVVTAEMDIQDRVGELLQEAMVGTGVAASDTWDRIMPPPTAVIVDTVTQVPVQSQRLRPVGSLDFRFEDATDPMNPVAVDVTGVDLEPGARDFVLTRDTDVSDGVPGQPVSLSGVSVEQLTGSLYRIDLTGVTGVDGFYELTLTANGDIEAVGTGNDFLSPVTISFNITTAITVDRLTDSDDASAGDGTAADSSGMVSLRAAIQEANALPGPDTIILPAGNYTLTDFGPNEDLAGSGDLDIRDTLTIIGDGASVTTIDAVGLGDRLFQVFAGVQFEMSGVTLTGGRVTGSEDGGALRTAGTVTLTDAVIVNNSSEDDAGAINNTGTLSIERTTIAANAAASSGGGIRNSGTLTIRQSTIGGPVDVAAGTDLRNTARMEGGGLINISGGVTTVIDSTFSGNVANIDAFGTGGIGGAISNRATLSLQNVTVTNNEADVQAGGIFSTGTANVLNTLIAANTAGTTGPDVDGAGGTFTSQGNNFIGDPGTVTAFVNGVMNDQVGAPGGPIDPMIGSLSDNGGPTLTHALLLGSPAIDTGSNVNAGLTSLDLDQRGSTRILDGDGNAVSTVDIGAFEFGGLFVNDPRDLPDPNPGDGLLDVDPFTDGVQITLRSAVMEANALPGENTIVVPAGTFTLDQVGADLDAPTVTAFDLDVSVVDVATASLSFSEQVTGVDITDFSLEETREILSVSDDTVSPIVITTASTQGLSTGDMVTIGNVQGNTAANGTFAITVIDGTTFSLNGTAGNGVFIPGGARWSRPVSLAGLMVTQTSRTDYTIDLNSVAQPDGQYVLTLTAAGSGIQDLLTNALVTDAATTATRGVDSIAPSADIVNITPDPRLTPVGPVVVTFTEQVNNVTAASFTLTQTRTIAGTTGDLVSPITITTTSTAGLANGDTVTVTGVTGNTNANGTFTITVVDGTTFSLNGSTGNGAYAGGGQWARDIDLVAAGITATAIPGSNQFTLDLTSVTDTPGDYTLTLDPALAGISDVAGNQLLNGDVDSWTINDPGPDVTGPVGDIIDITPDPRIDDAGIVTIQFDEDVTGVDIADFTLTRDIGSGPVALDISGLTVDPVAGSMSEYTLDLSSVTAIDGTYTLTLVTTDLASPIQDSVGNTLATTASDTWTVGENGAVIGDLDVTDTSGRLRIVGVGAGTTTINAGGLDRAFEVLDNVRLEIFDLTVTGGNVVGGGDGGGVLNSGELLISGGAVTGNTTDGDGGGIHNDTSGTITLTATTVSGNTGQFGGGIFSADDGTLTIANGTIISGNTASIDGGGVFADRRSQVDITSSTLRGNTATRDGGGFYNNDVSVANVIDSVFENNTAVRNGGGIFNEENADLALTSSTISDNDAVNGAGLFNDDGQVTIVSSIVTLNDASNDGGAIFSQSSGNIDVTDTNFSANEAGRHGGAIRNAGTLTVDDSTLALNTAANNGGAIDNLGTLSLQTSLFSGNEANEGGAIHNNGSGALTITESTLDRNRADVHGGGLFNSEAAQATIIDSTFSRNVATTDGGAVYHNSDGTVSISRSTVTANTAAGDGAGLHLDKVGSIVNSTITGNSAGGAGGGIYSNDDLTITHSTVYQNTATGRDSDGNGSADEFGGGIFNNAPFDPVNVFNTIVASNTATSDPDVGGEQFTSTGFNLIGDIDTAQGFTNGTNGDLVGGQTGAMATAVIDPQLGSLASNGGPTQTHALLFGSPARDAGNNLNAPATDQRDFSRIVDGDGNGVARIDIGAFESGFVVNGFFDSVDVSPGDRVSADQNGFSTLRASVIEANALTGNNTIILGPGRFELSVPGRDEDSALTGDLDITDDLTIIGAGADQTIIDGNALDRIFDVLPGVTLNLTNLTVVGGRADDGGGIRNLGTLQMDNVAVRSNEADFGGGVYTGQTIATLEFGVNATDTVLTLVAGEVLPQNVPFEILVDNELMRVTAVNGDDITVERGINGTIAVSHLDLTDVVLRAETTITNSTIGGRLNSTLAIDQGNIANIQGGGLYNEGILTVTDSTVSANQANAQGGGLFNNGIVTVTTSTFGGLNTADDQFGNISDSRGGGIYNIRRFSRLSGDIDDVVTSLVVDVARDFPATPSFTLRIGSEELTVTALAGNTFTVTRGVNGTLASSHSTGDTVVLVDKSFVTIDRSTIAGNQSSSNGAGIANGDVLLVTNSTISGNVSGASGAAIDTIGETAIRNTTITANSADMKAGGVNNAGTNNVRVRNTIIAFNTAGDVTDPNNDVQGVFISEGTNLIGDAGTSTGFVNGTNGDQVGSAGSPFDPILGPLAANGGPTLTHAPLSGSPAINNADNTGGPNVDQRGEPRPTDASADIGSVELDAVVITIDNLTQPEGDSGQSEFDFTLRLSRATVQPVQVDFDVLPGLVIVDPATGQNITTTAAPALNGDDFLTESGTITFTPGELVATLTVLVNSDLFIEPDEIFSVQLSNAVNAVLGNTEATGTIQNDDTSITINDGSVVEGDTGTVDIEFTIELAQPTVEEIQVRYTTANDSGGAAPATAGIDYQAVTNDGTNLVTFMPGETSKTVTVTVGGDTSAEAFETFLVDIELLSGSATPTDLQAVGTIQNDDIQLALSGGGTITETTGVDTTLPFTITMVAADGVTPVQNAFPVGVTIDIDAMTATAVAGEDFELAAGDELVTIDVGDTSSTVNVTIIGDTKFEGGATAAPETFTVDFVDGTVTRDSVAYTEVPSTLGVGVTGSIIDDELPPTIWVVRRHPTDPTMGQILKDDIDDGMEDPQLVRNYPLNAAVMVDQEPGDKNDRFIIDFVNGNPIPNVGAGMVGVFIDGGDQTAGDSLEIRDSDTVTPFTFTSVEYTATGGKNGDITINDGAGQTGIIQYADLEPVLDTVAAVDRTFTISSAAVANPEIRISNSGGLTVIRDDDAIATSAFENVTFTNPTSTLTVNAGSGANRVTVGALDAAFAAAPPSLTINAGSGNDTIDASAFNGSITINGEGGNDVLTGTASGDMISGGSGTDNIVGGAGGDVILGGDDNDTIDAGSGADNVTGGQGDDNLTGGSENDTIDGGAGDDVITGDGGDDALTGGDNNDSIQGGDGADDINGDAGQDTIGGDAGQDTVDGGDDADTVDGGADVDTVRGGTGNDVVTGGDGNDRLEGGDGSDTLDGGQGVDDIDGGSGPGVDRLSGSVTGSQNATLTDTTFDVAGEIDTITSIEEVIILGGDGSNMLDAAQYTGGSVTIEGGDGNDTLMGSAGPDSLNAGLGDDSVDAGDGNDTAFGGGGRDTINGGIGNDFISGNSGNDVLNGESGFDSIAGGDGDDLLTGGDLNDTLDGDTGHDTLMGDGGNDRLVGDAGHDVADGGSGLDRIFGNAGNDTLMGGDNRDTVNGGSGRDVIDGGADKDRLLGGAGGDTLITDGSGVDTLNGQGSGLDSVVFTGTENDDLYLIENLGGRYRVRNTGAGASRTVIVRTERVTLDLLGGNDTVTAADLAGVIGVGTFTINLGSGNDVVDAGTNTNANFRFVVTAGAGDDTVTTNAGNDNVMGEDGNDSISTGLGDDTVTGGQGSDFLNGMDGMDVLDGGTENDTLLGGSEADSLTGGDGDDSVNGNGGEDTIRGGRGRDILIGEESADNIFGDDDADSISGGGGNDNIFGGDGNDVIRGEDGEDFIEGGNGNDIISGGLKNDRINGQDGRDTLLGDADDDTLTGGAREDLLVGGRGADEISGQGTNRDTLVGETGLEGADDDTPDAGDTFDNSAEINNAFVVPTGIFDALNGF